MNKDKLEKIINLWGEEHGRTFNAANRKERLADLIMDLVYNGFTRADIEDRFAKNIIMSKMVARRSKFGVKALREWQIDAESDIRAAILNAFTEVKERTEEVYIKPEDTTLTAEQIEEATRNAYIELPDIETKIDYDDDESNEYGNGEYSSEPVIRPELDKSFKRFTTTPIMSNDDFFALIGREENE